MKRDGKYRFSLQFSDDTAEGRKAGELLESYGNRKSMIIVAALNEYIDAHPELKQKNCSIRVSVTSLASLDELEQMVRRVVEERINGLQPQSGSEQKFSSSISSETEMNVMGNPASQKTSFAERDRREELVLNKLEADVFQMLDNLDFFQ